MKILLLVVLLTGCTDKKVISDSELIKKAQDFCSCLNGLWYVGRSDGTEMFEIKCNDGTYQELRYNSIVFRSCE